MRLGSDDFNEKGVRFDDAVWAVGVMKEHGLDLADLRACPGTTDSRRLTFRAGILDRGGER
jgi:hypothetical protein